MTIKKWFLEKNYTSAEIFAINCAGNPVVKKETEKAMFLIFNTKYGQIKGWFPKSAIFEEVIEEPSKALEKFEIGTKVFTVIGNGIVVKTECVGNDNLITVKFDNKKEKTFLQSVANIKIA